jgi:site-specific DNA-methyltransferase (adenine-specific)
MNVRDLLPPGIAPYYLDEQANLALLLGDCGELLPRFPRGAFDLVFTSPPYNLKNSTGNGFKGPGRGRWENAALMEGYDDHDDAMPWPEYTLWQQGILRGCWDLLNDHGAVYYNHKPRVQANEVRLPTMYNPGLPLRQVIIWKRAGGMNFNSGYYLPMHEWIMVLAKPAFRLKSQGASGIGDVWDVCQEKDSDHPAPFPVGLPLRALETTGAKSILDPFAGSGTTLMAAKLLGAAGVGIDNCERYLEGAARRLSQGTMVF